MRDAVAAFPGVELVECYGATETTSLVTVLRHEQRHLDHPRGLSCGRQAPGVRVRVVDSSGRDRPRGEVGEVVVRGPNVTPGYWARPAETAEAFVDGWYRTGDLGHLDADSYLHLVDRRTDMVVSGGENVYSLEVEEVLARHPAVDEVVVFGVPDHHWGEAVHAVVVPRAPVAAHDLAAHCRRWLAGYKIPKRIQLRAAPLPRSGAGKVYKQQLRDWYWRGHVTRIGG